MTTAFLVDVEAARLDNDTPVHWCCVIQADLPLWGLCGELPLTQRRKPGARVSCPRCLELITEHVTTCGPCRPYAGKYR